MVWNDEFDGTELDSTKWRYEVNGLGGGNGELQYYTDENVVVSDGTLKIIARKEEYNGKEYTSSRITTQFTQDWKYGKFQIRAKLPGGRGTWPAIWMIPMYNAYGGWPDSGEIDIMESVGYDPYKVHSTLHTEIFNDANFNSQKGSSKTLSDPMNNFHVYELEWLPETIRFYVDGELIFTYVPRDYKVCPTSQQWPFDKQFFMILNVAIGGSWGGINGVDNTIFPVEMEVDYVRVFQSETITDIKPIE